MRGDGESGDNVTIYLFSPIRYFSFDRFCIGDSLWRMIVIALTAELKKK